MYTKPTRPIILFLLLLWLPSAKVSALIPATISYGTYTVSTNDVCNSICTVMPNCTLKIQGNITATFLGDIRVKDRATLIIDGATVKMAPNTRIFLHAFVATGVLVPTDHRGAYMTTSNNAVITCTTSGQFWTGILSMGVNAVMMTRDNAIADLYNTRLEYARSALNTRYVDALGSGIAAVPPPPYNIGFAGQVSCFNVHFQNNLRSVYVYGSRVVIYSNGTDPYEAGQNYSAQFNYCTFDYTPGFSGTTSEMVRLVDSRAVLFRSCTFTGKIAASQALYTTTGINAISSGFRVEKHGYFNTPCKFTNLQTGIAVVNALQVDRRPLIRDGVFQCYYGINTQGVLNALMINNNFTDNGLSTYFGIYLRNSTGYRVEANDLDAAAPAGPGIVVKNSGGAYNEIYRNQVSNRILGIQSLGNNRTASELSGLKILCNRIETRADITIMKDPAEVINGMNRNQFVPGTVGYLSAGNRFLQGPIAGAPYHNYYIEPGTNNMLLFTYKKNQNISPEDPSYRNFSNISNANNNICPVHNAGATLPPYPWTLFTARLTELEANIDQLEDQQALTEEDSTTLGSLWTAHASLIDSAVLYYQDNDQNDSVAIVYEQVTKGYRYKMLLAAAYAAQGNYTNARNLLHNLAGMYTIPVLYELSPEEVVEIEGIALLYECYEWLAANTDDWNNLPKSLKEAVLERAEAPMYDGAMARALLAQYEDDIAGPDYRLPEQENMPMSGRPAWEKEVQHIYPNPAAGQLFIKWDKGSALLLLKDLSGKTVLQQPVTKGTTRLPISHLSPGIYFAALLQQGKVVYRQKLVKQ